MSEKRSEKKLREIEFPFYFKFLLKICEINDTVSDIVVTSCSPYWFRQFLIVGLDFIIRKDKIDFFSNPLNSPESFNYLKIIIFKATFLNQYVDK